MSDMKTAPDLAERRRALEPMHSFIVQAPAGSGKTGLLIQRYLRLLAQVDAPEEIVAITFTRKAAAEMRERVLTALAQSSKLPNISETEHDKLTRELAAAVLQRDAAAGWQISANPARLRIQTIDSLCASLTRQMPMLSKFGSQPESVEDAADLYLDAARATIALVEGNDEMKQVAQDVERLLEHLDNDVARVETLLAGMLAQRDHWLRHIHGKDRDELEAALINARGEALERLCGLFPASVQDDLLALCYYAAANFIAIGVDSPVVACAELEVLPGSEEHDVVRWCGIADLLLKKLDGAWRRQYIVSNGFPPGKTKAEKEIAKSWKERALTLIAVLKESDALRLALHDIRLLPPPVYTESQWAVLGSITRLLPHAVGQLKLVFQLRGQVDFTEVAQGAVRALGEPDDSTGPTDLALALDYRIQHLLIDEFQDTSISQYELVEKLTAGWEPGDGRSLFIVGDPMQSIYRFREAEVGLFLRARAAGIANVVLQPISLSANFRSQRGIVDWVNASFTQVMPQREDIAAGAVSYTPSVATHDALDGKAVTLHPLFNNNHAGEAAKVVEIVAQTRRENPLATVAILVRSRNHLHEIVPQLKQAGLRFRAIEIEGLGRRPVVQDLLALTRALAHPVDRLAWLALLRAPWCGLTLADLLALASTQSAVREGATIRELLNDSERMATISADGSARLLRVREVIEHCIANRHRQSLRATVEAAWLALGGPACVDSATDLEDAGVYLDFLEAHEESGVITELAAFEEKLAKLYALPDLQADDTLQIMTIHKAKGLEFDCVIVPGLGRSSRSNDKKLFMWMERPALPGRVRPDLLLAPIHETGTEADDIYTWLEKLDSEKQRFEDERLLYVAATRAKQRLHLLGNTNLVPDKDGVIELKPPAAKTLLSKLWPVVQPDFAEAASQELSSSTAASVPLSADGKEIGGEGKSVIDQSLRRLVSGWMLPAAPPCVVWQLPKDRTQTQDAIEFSWVGETARHVGSVVHRWLQRIAEDEMKGWNAVRIELLRDTFRQELAACGLNDGDSEAASMRVSTALTHALSDERGQWLLGPQQEASNELRKTAMISGERMNLVIDRTFVGADGQRWIVDYKTSSHQGADVAGFLDREQERYRAQLDRYAAIMRMLDERPVKLGLYFPLLQGWREWGM